MIPKLGVLVLLSLTWLAQGLQSFDLVAMGSTGYKLSGLVVFLIGNVMAFAGEPVSRAAGEQMRAAAQKLQLLLPFLVCLGLTSCAPILAYLKDFGACMQRKGLVVAAGLLDRVFAVLDADDRKEAILNQLVLLAGAAGKDAVACAVSAWQSAHPPGKPGDPHRVLVARAAADDFQVWAAR